MIKAAKAEKIFVLSLFAVVVYMLALVVSHFFHKDPPQPVSLKVEVASTEEARNKGLSGRVDIPMDSAMVFVWDKPAHHCMWDKDVKFDLDVGFIDQSGKVVETYTMPAGSEQPVCPSVEVRMAMETRAGVLKQ